MRTPNKFINPRTGDTYEWQINHLEEDAVDKRRNIEHTAPTGTGKTAGVGLVKQQGADSPMVIKYTGTILHPAQHQAMIDWFALSAQQTVIFEDFAGERYEVIITDYAPKRERVMRNSKALGTPMELYVIRYSIEMEVLTFVAGPWQGVAA